MLLITLGDPHSSNIRGVFQCLEMTDDLQAKIPVVLIGSYFQWIHQCRDYGRVTCADGTIGNYDFTHMKVVEEIPQQAGLFFWDLGGPEIESWQLSQAQCGAEAYRALSKIPKESARLAVITCPVDKKKISLLQPDFVGQTEFFESLWEGDAVMLLSGPSLRVALATNHLALKNVSSHITVDLLNKKVAALVKTLKVIWNLENPKIAICGLNPHCGDQGLFGTEDQDVIAKFIQEWSDGAELCGPLPADTVFHFARTGKFHAVLAMYHDQGLGPIKTIHFDEAINISGGLRHLRVSPDHGPAADLMSSSLFSVSSFRFAFQTAIDYLEKRLYAD